MKEQEIDQTAQNQSIGTQYVLLNKSEDRSVYFKNVEKTPFVIIHDTKQGYTIVVGKQQVVKNWYKDEQACLNIIKKKDWELLCATIISLALQIAEDKFYELQKR